MLFFAAAILYSSVHVLGVTGSVAVPAHDTGAVVLASHLTVATAPARASADSAGAIDAVPLGTVALTAPEQGVPSLAACGADSSDRATDATTSGDFSSAACLAQLTSIPLKRLEAFDESLDADSGQDLAFATALDHGGSAAATKHWWATVTAARRTDLITAMPSVLGNLEGVPYAVRNLANRITLGQTIGRLEHREVLATAGVTAHATEAPRLEMLDKVRQSLDGSADDGAVNRSLVSLDTVFPGRAAIAVGDLDTADNVSVMVPGMLYTVGTQMVGFTGAAAAIQGEQDFWSNTLATTATKKVATSAVVAWMGYRTPGVTTVLGLGLAKAGAVQLEDAIAGLDATRQGSKPRVTLIAHSYGSTTSTIALSSGRIHVDDFVALGSPGSVVQTASQLAVTHGNVFAAAAPLDPVAGSSVFGADPGSIAFGAKLLNLGATVDPYTEVEVSAVVTHNQYFTSGSHAMRSLALIGIGRGDLADGRIPDPDAPTTMNGPTFALVRPQDVNREALSA